MKAGIVNFSTLKKYDNWSPDFYLDTETKLEDAQRREARAKALLAKAAEIRCKRLKELSNLRRMVKEGEVKPLG